MTQILEKSPRYSSDFKLETDFKMLYTNTLNSFKFLFLELILYFLTFHLFYKVKN
jgi:hypothetical protein